MGIQRDQLSSDTKSYLVLVSESISKQYLVHANSEEEATKIHPKRDYTIWIFALFFVAVLILIGDKS